MQIAANVKERPILFSGAMVRALLDGRKTQTRRVFKLPSWAEWYVSGAMQGEKTGDIEPKDPRDRGWYHIEELSCPHGAVGDRLWVRESLKFVDTTTTRHDHVLYAADGVRVPRETGLVDWACDGMAFGFANSVPSIHMPRWASRITLEVTGVRVERLQDISDADAIAEGIQTEDYFARQEYFDCVAPAGSHGRPRPIPEYQSLWDSLNAARGYGWDVNPWVWVVQFERVEP